MGPKALACLEMARLKATDPERERLYEEASKKWSEKAVCVKFLELSARGYIDYGVSARTGWLTDKGKKVLNDL